MYHLFFRTVFYCLLSLILLHIHWHSLLLTSASYYLGYALVRLDIVLYWFISCIAQLTMQLHILILFR